LRENIGYQPNRTAAFHHGRGLKELCMERKNTAVFGLYATPATAENGVDHLITLGFANQAISVLMPDDDSTRAFAHQKNTKAPEGTAAGAATGGVVGGTLGVLAGLGVMLQ
jgi:hypothetical protein